MEARKFWPKLIFYTFLKNVSCMPRWTILRNCPKSVRILRCVFHLFWQFLLKVSPLRRESIWTVFDQKSSIFEGIRLFPNPNTSDREIWVMFQKISPISNRRNRAEDSENNRQPGETIIFFFIQFLLRSFSARKKLNPHNWISFQLCWLFMFSRERRPKISWTIFPRSEMGLYFVWTIHTVGAQTYFRTQGIYNYGRKFSNPANHISNPPKSPRNYL